MNGTLLDLFGVIAASTGLPGAPVSGALAFLLPREACGFYVNHFVRRFSKRNDVKEYIM